MRQQLTQQKAQERGATLVEYAIVAPFLFLMLFGIIEFALLTASFTGSWTAAREGARYATTVGESVVSPGTGRYLDCVGIRQASRGIVTIGQPTDGQIAIRYFDPTGVQVADCDEFDSTYPAPTVELITSGSQVEVAVTRSYEAIVPMLGRFIDGVTLDSTQRRSIYQGVIGAD
jgi:Flp pilus assembly protein TadG